MSLVSKPVYEASLLKIKDFMIRIVKDIFRGERLARVFFFFFKTRKWRCDYSTDHNYFTHCTHRAVGRLAGTSQRSGRLVAEALGA